MEKQTSLKMIQDLSNAYGASGFEDDVLLVGRKYGEGLARIEENCIRDLFFYRNENTGDKPVILLDGHSDEFFDQMMAINVTAIFRLMRDALPLLKRSPYGRIILIGSVMSSFGEAGMAAYSASKHAVLGMTKSQIFFKVVLKSF